MSVTIKFVADVTRFVEEKPEMGAFLTVHNAEDLAEHTVISKPGAGVSVSPDGDIQNLFNNSDTPGMGRELLKEAIDMGGVTLDCYDGYLREVYAEFGFRETGRMRFDPDYAPDGWNFGKYGTPDVVFMALNPESADEISEKYYESQEWERAKSDARRAADSE